MKLYYSPGACSLASHIVMREALLPVELIKIDLATHRTEDGRDFTEISSLGLVPALEFDNGQILTEGPAIMQYVGDQAPSVGLVPSPISFERYRFQSWLNFVATEVHKGFAPLFSPNMSDEARTHALDRLKTRFEFVEKHLTEHEYLLGKEFCAVDAYLFVMTTWLPHVNLELASWPALAAFNERVKARPHVQEAMKAEGLPV